MMTKSGFRSGGVKNMVVETLGPRTFYVRHVDPSKTVRVDSLIAPRIRISLATARYLIAQGARKTSRARA